MPGFEDSCGTYMSDVGNINLGELASEEDESLTIYQRLKEYFNF